MAVTYIWINSHILLYSYQAHYILHYTDLSLTLAVPKLAFNMYIVFSIRSVVTAKKTSFNRYQIRLTPDFVFTEFKVQRMIFEFAVLNLQ